MKNFVSAVLCLSFLVFSFPKKSHASDPLTISLAALGGLTVGLGLSYSLVITGVNQSSDSEASGSSDESATEVTSTSTDSKVQYVQNVQSDALEFIASGGEFTTPLLEIVIEETYSILKKQGEDISKVTRNEIVEAVFQNIKAGM